MDEMRYAPGGLEQAPPQLISDSWSRRRPFTGGFGNNVPEPMPVAATQGVLAEPNYSGGLGSLMGGMSGANNSYGQAQMTGFRTHPMIG
jgi:hypothetical protein